VPSAGHCWSALEWVKAMETAPVWDWAAQASGMATGPVLVTAQASGPELERDPEQAMATVTVKALAPRHANLNRHTQLPKIEWKRSRTRSKISNLYETWNPCTLQIKAGG
jgi:hypothetical protein